MQEIRPGEWQLSIKRIDGKFLEVVRRVAAAEPGVRVTDRDAPGLAGTSITMQGCALNAASSGRPNSLYSEQVINVWPDSGAPANTHAGCEAALRRVAKLIDVELATGKHDALLKLD